MVAQDLQRLDDLLALAEQGKDAVKASGDTQLQSLWEWLYQQIKQLIDGLASGLSSVINDVGSGVKNWVTDRVSDVKTIVNNGFTNVKTWVTGSVTALTNTITNTETNIKTFITNSLGGIGDAIANAINGVKNAIASIKDSIASLASDFAETIASFIGVIIDDVSYIMGQVMRDVTDSIKRAFQSIYDSLAKVYNNIRDAITNAIADLKEGFIQAYNTVKEALLQAYNATKEAVTDVYNQVSQWLTNTVKGIKDELAREYESVIEFIRDLYDQIYRVVSGAIKDLGEIFTMLFRQFLEWFMPKFGLAVTASEQLTEIAKWLLSPDSINNPDVFNERFSKLVNLTTDETLNNPIGQFFYGLARFWVMINLQFVPAQVSAARNAEINLGLSPAPDNLMQNAYLLGRVSRDDLLENMRLAGISRARAEKALEGLRNLPTPGSVQEAYLRGIISEDDHDTYLKAMGYKDDDIKVFKALYFRLPPVSDLIRMAVREAFTPEIAERFGQYEDYPEAFTKWAVQQGFTEEWAKAYWAAHWDLPSPTMGFEMLHRGIISEDELKLLLRALDVMPFWREKLIQLSYNPLTRVDVRRMYQLGVLTEDEVYKAYLDLGYNDVNARRLTEFTKRYSAPEDDSELTQFRTLARNTYAQAYKKGLISRDEYKAFLLNLKYVEDDAELLITLDDYAIADKAKLFDLNDYRKDYLSMVIKAYKVGVLPYDEFAIILKDLGYTDNEITLEVNAIEAERSFYLRSLVLDRIGEMYVNFILDDTQVYTYLNVFGFGQAEIDRAMEEWQIARNLRTKRPPISDIKKFYTAGLITLDDFLNELRGQGYNERYINLYRQSMGV